MKSINYGVKNAKDDRYSAPIADTFPPDFRRITCPICLELRVELQRYMGASYARIGSTSSAVSVALI